MFVLQAKFSHDPEGRPCYIAGNMSTPSLTQADRFATRAEAEARAEQSFPEPTVVALHKS